MGRKQRNKLLREVERIHTERFIRVITAINRGHPDLATEPLATDLSYFEPNSECFFHACARTGNLAGAAYLQKLGWSDFPCPSPKPNGWSRHCIGAGHEYGYSGTNYFYEILACSAYIEVGQRVLDVVRPDMKFALFQLPIRFAWLLCRASVLEGRAEVKSSLPHARLIQLLVGTDLPNPLFELIIRQIN